MEHIWVEAAVDFHPSRGVKNLVADSWVGMDPSFKQIEVLAGLDVVQISGINPEQLMQGFLASGTANEAEGWATGFNPAVLLNAQAQASQSLANYIEQNLPNATVGDIAGGRRIFAQSVPVLATSLPHRIVAAGVRFAAVPSALQQQITFAFGKDTDGESVNPKTFPWAQLNNKQVTLSFRPATQADEDALLALLSEGEITDISQLPSSIPAYLLNVVPELKVDGTVVDRGSAMVLGSEFNLVFNPRFVSAGVKPLSYKLPAGAYLALAVVAGSISSAQLASTRAQMQATRTTLESGNTQTPSLTRERLMGDMFQAGALGYFAQYIGVGAMSGMRQGSYHQLAAGVGSFGYEPRVDFFFGVPRRLQTGGITLNIPIVNIVGKDALAGTGKRDFTMQLGALSSILEHAVPEQMFTSSTNPGEAVSAVKALGLASAAGQRIYQITPANQGTTLPMVRHNAATMDEIRSALATGKTVITHASVVPVPGWSGAGYIIMDADTGSAAWKITGGQNGGFLFGALLGLMLFIGVTAAVIGVIATMAGLIAGLLLAEAAVFLILVTTVLLLQVYSSAATDDVRGCLLLGLSLMAGLLGLLFTFFPPALVVLGKMLDVLAAAIGLGVPATRIGDSTYWDCFG